MDTKAIFNQAEIENETLEHIKDALLATLAWQVEGKVFSRKLSSLRFVARWFREHLERLFSIEEHDGYMAVVVEACPHLIGKVEALRREHNDLRADIQRIMPQLERVVPTDHERFGMISDELQQLIKRLDRHTAKENELFQEAMLREEGVCD